MRLRLSLPISLFPPLARRLVRSRSRVESVHTPRLCRHPPQPTHEILARPHQLTRAENTFGTEVRDADIRNQLLEGRTQPSCPRSSRLLSNSLEKLFGRPSDPAVSWCELHDRAPERTDPDDCVVRSGSIAHQNPHLSPRRTEVGHVPCVPEVPPDIEQPQPGELAGGVRVDNLNVWIDALAKGVEPVASNREPRGLAQAFSELPPVSHEREDRMPLATMQPSALHFADEPADRWLAQLGIPLDEVCSSDLGFTGLD